MRFILLEEPNNSVPKAYSLTVLMDDESVAVKRPIALQAMTDLNIRNCEITYLSQKVKDSKHPVFNIIYLLATEFKDNKQVLQVYKNFQDIDEINDNKHFDNVLKVLESLSGMEDSRIEKLEEILVDAEFYKRDPKDFEYSFKLLSILISPAKLKKYFKDPDIVNFDDLMINGHLKPAGINPLDTSNDTLFGTVRSWSNNKSGKSDSHTDADNTEADTDASTNSYFVSFEEVKSDLETPEIGQKIQINGEFEYDPNYNGEDAKGWRPVQLFR